MADHQRIHPVAVHDPEAPPPPTAPLVPHGAAKSERGEPPATPPPFHRTIPPNYSRPPKRRRSCFCKCFCWTLFLIVIIIVLLGILAAIIYFVFKPKLPSYSIDSLRITQFSLDNNASLAATFNVNITADNPNKKIGIYYLSGSSIRVWYTSTQLCRGSLPAFYQGHRNITVIDVALTGHVQNGTSLVLALQAQQQTGTIPLTLAARVPVKIKLGSLKLMKWKFLVNCNVMVDSLSTNNDIIIKSSNCKFRFRL